MADGRTYGKPATYLPTLHRAVVFFWGGGGGGRAKRVVYAVLKAIWTDLPTYFYILL